MLDTTFLIDLLKNNPSALAKAEEIDRKSVPVLTTSVTVFELWQGVHDAPNEEKDRVLLLIDSFGLEKLDLDAAKEAGAIFDSLRKKGEEIGVEDCMIAGIAKTRGEVLLTKNIKHFKRVAGLQIESY